MISSRAPLRSHEDPGVKQATGAFSYVLLAPTATRPERCIADVYLRAKNARPLPLSFVALFKLTVVRIRV